MALPTIVYNASTGSDSAASGAGPSTAVTGTSAAHTGGVSSTTITLTNTPDLSGVATDGSAALWLNTSAGGRHLSKITAVNDGADTVTVEDNFNIAAGSAVDYAIGGKRQTTDNDTSNPDLNDLKAGWIMELEAGTYTQSVLPATSAGDVTNGPVTIRAATGASPTISSTTQSVLRVSGNVRIQGLTLTTTASASSRACIDVNADCQLSVSDCTLNFDATTCGGIDVASVNLRGCCQNVYFNGGVNGVDGFNQAGSRLNFSFIDCRFEAGDNGINIPAGVASFSSVDVHNCLFTNQDNDGINIADADVYNITITTSTFYSPAADGIHVSNAITTSQRIHVNGCIFDSCGNYGMNAASNGKWVWSVDYNAFRNNASADYLNLDAGTNDISLTGDPFTNASSGDFSLNNTAGAGAACRAGHVGANQDGTNTSYRDIGALQHQDAGGGGGGGTSMIGVGGGMIGVVDG